MNADERKNHILNMLSNSDTPVSGTELAKELNCSRQIIVQDIALLRANGAQILSTTKGYMLSSSARASRVFKTIHSDDEVTEELNIIVDLGGIVEDVFVSHRVYGVVRAELNIKSRKDVQIFTDKIKSGCSSLLMNTTSGYHYHTITAEDEETLDMIFEELKKKGFLAPLQDYEPIDFGK
ncbi:MAG: transcription repressor NadR [Butyrivibrio sp.]